MINSKSDLLASLDNDFSGVLADRDRPNHAALGAALGRIAGVRDADETDPAGEDAVSTILDAVDAPDHLVFVMLDGFGMNFVDTLPSDSFVRRNTAFTMRSLFPTSTGPNLMSLATGVWPAEHGNLGWHVHIPRLRERITPLIWTRTRDSRSLDEIGFSPQEMLLRPVIPLSDGVAYIQVVDEHIAKSATTNMYGQSRTEAFSYDGDPVSQIVGIVGSLLSQASERNLIYIYWHEVDSAAHQYGTTHPITRAAVQRASALVEALGNALQGEARLVATADHGHLDSPDKVWSSLTPSHPLRQMLTCTPAGEPRALFFHTKPGQQDAFRDGFVGHFGDRFSLIAAADLLEMGVLGRVDRVADEARGRIGDFLAISRGKWAIHASEDESSDTLQSMHGGITVAETIVPLIVA